MERNMQGSGTSHETLDRCETIVRDYLAQGEYTLGVGVLIQHYQDAIVSYCRCHLLDQEIAQEAAQEIFLTAFERMPGFRGHSSIKTWLYGIARKKCLEVRRTRKRRATLVRMHQDTISARVHCEPPSPPEDLVSQEYRRRQVWHALRRLRGYERELLVLRYLENLTYDEIASILNVSRRTVERHLPRAEARFCHAYERCHTHARSSRRTALDAPAYAGLIPLVPDVRPS
jgi:RNA polymerase sigma-70 factor (ECF subfamily)